MIKNKQILIGILAMFFCCSLQAHITPYFGIRSQGLNTPRHLAGVVQQVYAVDKNAFYGTFSAALEYTRSFDNDTITRCLFGTQSCPAITISGSQVEGRGATDWLADYFYLPTDFKSTVNFNPIVDNALIDFNFYLSLDDWADGLYLAIYAPLVHTRWHLNMCETVDMKGTNSHLPGYFTPNTLQRNELLNNFTEYANGNIVLQPVAQTIGSTEFITPITFQQLRRARMSSCRLTKTRLADIRFEFGYHFIRNQDYHVGFGIYNSAPTGNRPEGEFLFEPMVGNGHHWELGAALNGHYTFWHSQDEEKLILVYLNAVITHLFSTHQERTFDLAGKPFSRYALIERLGNTITSNLQGDGVTPSAQFNNEFLPVANLSHLCVNVNSTVQAEITALFTLVCDNFSWDIGYNFWIRSCDATKLRGINPFENNSKWAIKGDAHVFGYDRGAAGAGPLIGAVALSATESKSTIFSGTNFTADRSLADAIKNPGIDNAANATGDASGGAANNPLSAEPFDTAISIQTSLEPILLNSHSIDVCAQSTRGISNKFFTDFSYVWKKGNRLNPYLGIGGEVEFHHKNNSCDESCDSCITCALSQWGVWLKGGLTF